MNRKVLQDRTPRRHAGRASSGAGRGASVNARMGEARKHSRRRRRRPVVESKCALAKEKAE